MKPYYEQDGITIYHADALEILPALSNIDLILTDPPYPKEHDHVWDILGDCAHIGMRDGASLITLCGHYQVPRALHALARHLTYHWICILPNRMQPIMHGWNIKACFKPILWFAKGQAPRRHGLIVDNFALNGGGTWEARLYHRWGQDTSSTAIPMRVLTNGAPSFVVDPFVGSGTTLVVARSLGVRAVGIDCDEAACESAVLRLQQQIFNFIEDESAAGDCGQADLLKEDVI